MIAPYSTHFFADVFNRRHDNGDIGITASYDQNVTITMTNDVAGTAGNVAIVNNVDSFASVSGMAGGVDSVTKFAIDADGLATLGTVTFNPVAESSVPNATLFFDDSTGKLRFKDGSGVSNDLY